MLAVLLHYPDALFQILKHKGQFCVEAKVVFDLIAGGDDGGIVPVEGLTDGL